MGLQRAVDIDRIESSIQNGWEGGKGGGEGKGGEGKGRKGRGGRGGVVRGGEGRR